MPRVTVVDGADLPALRAVGPEGSVRDDQRGQDDAVTTAFQGDGGGGIAGAAEVEDVGVADDLELAARPSAEQRAGGGPGRALAGCGADHDRVGTGRIR